MRGRPRDPHSDRGEARAAVSALLKKMVPAATAGALESLPAAVREQLEAAAAQQWGIPSSEAVRSLWRRRKRNSRAVLVHNDAIAIIKRRWPRLSVSEAVNNILIIWLSDSGEGRCGPGRGPGPDEPIADRRDETAT